MRILGDRFLDQKHEKDQKVVQKGIEEQRGNIKGSMYVTAARVGDTKD